MKKSFLITLFILIIVFQGFSQESNYEVIVLGTSQDGGYPQANCSKSCCTEVYESNNEGSYITSLALIDKLNSKVWLID